MIVGISQTWRVAVLVIGIFIGVAGSAVAAGSQQQSIKDPQFSHDYWAKEILNGGYIFFSGMLSEKSGLTFKSTMRRNPMFILMVKTARGSENMNISNEQFALASVVKFKHAQ